MKKLLLAFLACLLLGVSVISPRVLAGIPDPPPGGGGGTTGGGGGTGGH